MTMVSRLVRSCSSTWLIARLQRSLLLEIRLWMRGCSRVRISSHSEWCSQTGSGLIDDSRGDRKRLHTPTQPPAVDQHPCGQRVGVRKPPKNEPGVMCERV